MNNFYFKPPFRAAREEVLLSSVLSTQTGEDNYPGDMTVSENWPGVAPGERGMNNAISPKYCNLEDFALMEPGPPVLWVRGEDDAIVSDTSLLDFGFLGQLDAVPGWPGAEVSLPSRWSPRCAPCSTPTRPAADATVRRSSPTAATPPRREARRVSPAPLRIPRRE